MTTTTKQLRYQLPKKAIKADCPDCGPKHRKTLSRYVDTQTSESLPEPYGRCDREDNCGYHVSPYHKGPSGLSYHDEQKALTGASTIPKTWFRMAGKLKRNAYMTRQGVIAQLMETENATREQAEKVAAFIYDKPTPSSATPKEPTINTLPDELFTQSVGYYERNQFAQLLTGKFGSDKACELLNQYKIGTSTHWPGATVFWLIDEQGRVRGGQIKLFAANWHTEKYVDREGNTRSKTSWVHYALQRKLERDNKPLPDWLTVYSDEADKCPCLFGLPQLATAPADYPVAIVEAPKTALVCSAYLPGFVWLAVMGKSYLKPERLAAVRNRRITLFPDLNAYSDSVNTKGHRVKGWLTIADELRAAGFTVEVSAYLEENAVDKQKQAGLDLADFLLDSDSEDRIEDTVATDEVEISQPIEPAPFRLPRLIEHYWSLFVRPPYAWNRIRAHKLVVRYLSPDLPVEVVTTSQQQYDSPGSILRPLESQIERLDIEPIETYPVGWDQPTPPGTAPQIKPFTFHDWQQQDYFFSQLGLNSLNPNHETIY